MSINDGLYLHGGIARVLIDQRFTIEGINSTVRAALHGDANDERAEFLLGELGPLWYRGYFAAPGDLLGASRADVDLTLEAFSVRRIMVGHTRVPTITSLYGGKVIAVQVYPEREAGQVSFEGLLIRDGLLLRARFDGTTETIAPAQ
jgi:hypothetical protein